MTTALLAGMVLAGVVATLLAGAISFCGPADVPRERSSHARPTPTSGGLAILAATAIGAVVAIWRVAGGAGPGEVSAVAWTVAVAGGLGLLGAVDDVFDLGAKAKLLIQAVVALAFALFVARVQALPLIGPLVLPLGPWVGVVGTALWIVVATNAVNFMDGANGVAGGAMAVAFLALGLGALGESEPAVAAVALAAAAANAGYLPWNLKGRLFQGDAGALFSGFLFASLAVVAERGGTGLYVYFGPLALLPFLADVLLTLLVRARRGGVSLLDAHRDHLYQLWLQKTGGSHAALAWRVAAVMAAFGAYALYLQHAARGVRAVFFCGAVAVAAVLWTTWRRRLEAAPAQSSR